MTTVIIYPALALVAVFWYFSKQIVAELKSLNKNVNDIKIELGALVTDHENVKDDIKELKVRLYDLEHA